MIFYYQKNKNVDPSRKIASKHFYNKKKKK